MQIADRLAELGVGHVHAGGADHLGVWRGKRVVAATAARGRIGFSDGVFGLDIAGEWVAPPAGHEGWYPSSGAGYPDMLLALDSATAVVCPWLGGEAWVLGEWLAPDGSPLPVCPRSGLRQVLAEFGRRNLDLKAAFELECYLAPADRTLHDRAYPYHGLRTALDRELVDAIVAPLEGSGLRIEAANFENGIGQLELNVAYRDALGAADEAFLAKQAVRVAAAGLGLRASFMARPFADQPGSSAHVHVSLWRGAEPAGDEEHLQALAGLLATLPAAVALCLPFANSYARLQPGSLAATTRTWAPENRTVALRTVGHEGRIERIEHRLPGADCNPYDALAAIAAGILIGLDEHTAPPPPPTLGNCDELPDLELLPRTPGEAVAALRADGVLAARVGADRVAHRCVMLEAEAETARRRVSEADRSRYFELA
jgi:glutamine synthetase